MRSEIVMSELNYRSKSIPCPCVLDLVPKTAPRTTAATNRLINMQIRNMNFFERYQGRLVNIMKMNMKSSIKVKKRTV